MAALEPDSLAAPSRLDAPPSVVRSSRPAALPDGFWVFLIGDKVLVEVAPKLDGVGLAEELHDHKYRDYLSPRNHALCGRDDKIIEEDYRDRDGAETL